MCVLVNQVLSTVLHDRELVVPDIVYLDESTWAFGVKLRMDWSYTNSVWDGWVGFLNNDARNFSEPIQRHLHIRTGLRNDGLIVSPSIEDAAEYNKHRVENQIVHHVGEYKLGFLQGRFIVWRMESCCDRAIGSWYGSIDNERTRWLCLPLWMTNQRVNF